jgi:hypothetical protein
VKKVQTLGDSYRKSHESFHLSYINWKVKNVRLWDYFHKNTFQFFLANRKFLYAKLCFAKRKLIIYKATF